MFLTLNIPPRHEERTLSDLPGLFRDTGAADFAFIVRAHPESPPHTGKVHRAMACFEKTRNVLSPQGVRSGVLIQTLMGHGERSTPVSPASFQRIVGAEGTEAPTQFCPLDPGFLDLTAEACSIITKHRPSFIMLDDDVRLAGSYPYHYGCMCQRHLDLYADHSGCHRKREELVSLFKRPDEAGLEARKAWQATLDESLLTLAGRVRESADAVEPTIRCGICVVAGLRPVTERLADKLAGENRPLVRVGQAFYNERGGKKFPLVMAIIAQQKAALPNEFETLSEADTYPHTRYSLSAAALRAYIAGSLLQGIDAPDLWISPTRQWAPDRRYRSMLSKSKSFFNALGELGKRVSWQGPACLSSGLERWCAPWTDLTGQAIGVPRWGGVLGRMGIPLHCHPPSEVNLIDGISAYGRKDEELEKLFRGALLIDGEAAEILSKRGCADLMGVEVTSDDNLRCNFEWCKDAGVHGESSDRHLICARRNPSDIRRLAPIRPGVKTPSWLMRRPGFQHPEAESVAPALTLYENEHNGRIAVYSHALSSFEEFLFVTDDRRRQLRGVLEWLSRGPFPCVTSEGDIYALYGTVPEDKTCVLAVFNLSLDVVENLTFSTCADGIDKLETLNPDGEWESLDWNESGGEVETGVRLWTMAPCILRWRML